MLDTSEEKAGTESPKLDTDPSLSKPPTPHSLPETNPLIKGVDAEAAGLLKSLWTLESAIFPLTMEGRYPGDWQDSSPEKTADALKSGRALALKLEGQPFVVVDVDVTRGGDIEATRKSLTDAGVKIRAEIETPSLGRHFYVAAPKDTDSVWPKETLKNLPGVEVLASGRNAGLPAAQISKAKLEKYQAMGITDPKYRVLSNELHLITQDDPSRFSGWLEPKRTRFIFNFEEHTGVLILDNFGMQEQARMKRYVEAALNYQAADLADMPEGVRNDFLRDSALKLGHFAWIIGTEAIVEKLTSAARKAGLSHSEIDKTIESSFKRALLEPRKPAPASQKVEGSDSWSTPVDLSEVIKKFREGTYKRPMPTIGTVLDQEFGLFYPGRVNGIAGESSSGKSILMAVVMCQEMERGNNVIYIDLEDEEGTVIDRMLDIGVSLDNIQKHFIYIHPHGAYDTESTALIKLIEKTRPTLIGLDSVGEALAISDGNSLIEKDVTKWFQLFPVALSHIKYDGELGPAIVLVDHVKHGNGTRDPVGSMRKKAAISGAQYYQGMKTKFTRKRNGWANIICVKDRLGNYTVDDIAAKLVVSHGEEASQYVLTTGGTDPETAAPEFSLPLDDQIYLILKKHGELNTTDIEKELQRDEKGELTRPGQKNGAVGKILDKMDTANRVNMRKKGSAKMWSLRGTSGEEGLTL